MKRKLLCGFLSILFLFSIFTTASYAENLLPETMRYGWYTRLNRTPENVIIIDRFLYYDGIIEPAGIHWYFTAPSSGVYEFTTSVMGYNGMKYTVNGVEFTANGSWQVHSMEYQLKKGEFQWLSVISLSKEPLSCRSSYLRQTVNNDPPPSPSLPLENGSFENRLDQWNIHGNDGFVFTTTDEAKSGMSSAYLSYFTSEPRNNYIEQTFMNPGEAQITLSAYVKASNLTGLGVYITMEAVDKNGILLASASNSPLRDTAGDWKLVLIHMLVPAETEILRILIGGIQCTGGFYVDDVTLRTSAAP